MTIPTTTQAWIVTNPPLNEVEKDTFTLEKAKAIPALKDGEVLIQVEYFSNDPAQRGWIQRDADPKRLYVPPVVKGDVMRSGGLGKIIASKSEKFKEGDRVSGSLEWAEYVVRSEKGVQPIQPIEGLSPSVHISALGGTGLTAWTGLTNIGHFKAGQTLLVSGAGGATGSAVVQVPVPHIAPLQLAHAEPSSLQIAKNVMGASRVVGIAGGAEKCKWVESLGADVCLDYKSPTFVDQLNAEVEFDLYFDNVGGTILDAALLKMKRHGRVACCGAIAAYNDKTQNAFPNWFEVISNRIIIQGFIAFDHISEWPEYKKNLAQAIKDGKLKVDETVVETKFEDIPKTWMGLFEGSNKGKLITKL